MNKPPPYQPTTQQMLAQAQAAQQAQQQAYLQQMTMYNPSSQPMGAANGRHRNTSTTTSSGTLGPAYFTYVGATGASVYTASPAGNIAPYPTIEEAGIRAGEIIAYRVWRLVGNDLLRSMYMDYIWRPGETQKLSESYVQPLGGNGFYAFKDMARAQMEYPHMCLGTPTVYGEVALWGEVYEHERGYRAECARITRLLDVGDIPVSRLSRLKFWRTETLTRLRRKYGVVE